MMALAVAPMLDDVTVLAVELTRSRDPGPPAHRETRWTVDRRVFRTRTRFDLSVDGSGAPLPPPCRIATAPLPVGRRVRLSSNPTDRRTPCPTFYLNAHSRPV